MSKYFDDPTRFDDAMLYLRNKNVLLVEDVPSSAARIARGVVGVVGQARLRLLRRSFGRSAKLVVSEQIVENAWVLSQLRDDDRRVLDFGGVESVLPLQLSALGKHVSVLDARRYAFTHANLQSIQADILAQPLPFTEPFDVVISISTIEHVGLSRYGDSADKGGDRRAVDALWGAVRPGGRLLATVPAGRPAVQRGYRVYDEARIRSVFPASSVIRWFKKDGRQGTWREVVAADIAHLVYEAPTKEAPVEAVALIAATREPTGDGSGRGR
jgi:2-polyprenyl-3-methyl-5-hydroxy-6-metoxy-1,4-benzoquinol methylase